MARQTAASVAREHGATVRAIHGTQCYEVTDRNGIVRTVSGDYGDDGKFRWYCRNGAFPGGAPWETTDSLWYAVYLCAVDTAGAR